MPGRCEVRLSNLADGAVVADAVRIDRLSDTIVGVTVTPSSVPEGGTGTMAYTFHGGGASRRPLTVSFAVGGTAAFGTDYTLTGAASFGASSGTVTFAAGSDTATVVVDPAADAVAEGDETVVLAVDPGPGYAICTPTPPRDIVEQEPIRVVTLGVAPGSVTEDGTGMMAYTFRRTGDLSAPLTVSFAVGGTATFATDYAQARRRQLRLDLRHGDLRRRQRHGHGDRRPDGRQCRRGRTRPSCSPLTAGAGYVVGSAAPRPGPSPTT